MSSATLSTWSQCLLVAVILGSRWGFPSPSCAQGTKGGQIQLNTTFTYERRCNFDNSADGWTFFDTTRTVRQVLRTYNPTGNINDSICLTAKPKLATTQDHTLWKMFQYRNMSSTHKVPNTNIIMCVARLQLATTTLECFIRTFIMRGGGSD
ncbi:uncharacterized protein LOC144144827 [Haemaphysalis longicornis]